MSRIVVLLFVLSCVACFAVGVGTGRLWEAANSAQRIKELEDTLKMNGGPNTIFQLPPAAKSGDAVQ